MDEQQERQEQAYQEEQQALKLLSDQWKWAQARMKLARERQLAFQAREAESARIERERIANIPTPEQTEYPIANLQILNGRIVNKPTPQISQAVIKTEQLRAANLAALKLKK
jgi:hypothetical protein